MDRWLPARWMGPLALLVLLGGCGGGATAAPRRAVLRFVADVEAGRYEAAYARMDEAYRERVPFERFVEHLRAHPEEVRRLAEAAREVPEEAEVVYELEDGDELRLRWEGGRWRVVGRSLDFYDRSTPLAAARAFVRALERRRWELLWRMAPRHVRAGTSAEEIRSAWEGRGEDALRRWVAALREGLQGGVEQRGEAATMRYGEGRLLQLVREDGWWCVLDPDG